MRVLAWLAQWLAPLTWLNLVKGVLQKEACSPLGAAEAEKSGAQMTWPFCLSWAAYVLPMCMYSHGLVYRERTTISGEAQQKCKSEHKEGPSI